MNISNCVSNWEFFLYFIHVLSTCAGRLTSMHGKKKKGTKNQIHFICGKKILLLDSVSGNVSA